MERHHHGIVGLGGQMFGDGDDEIGFDIQVWLRVRMGSYLTRSGWCQHEIVLAHKETFSSYKQFFSSLAPQNLQVDATECLPLIFHGERLFWHQFALTPCLESLQEPLKHVLKCVELLGRISHCSPFLLTDWSISLPDALYTWWLHYWTTKISSWRFACTPLLVCLQVIQLNPKSFSKGFLLFIYSHHPFFSSRTRNCFLISGWFKWINFLCHL